MGKCIERASLAIQWLRLHALNIGVRVWSLVREKRSHMLCGVAKRLKKTKKEQKICWKHCIANIINGFFCFVFMQKRINSFTWPKVGLDEGTSCWVPQLSEKWQSEAEIQFCWLKRPSFWWQHSHFCDLLMSLFIWVEAGDTSYLQSVHQEREGRQLPASFLPLSSSLESPQPEVALFPVGCTHRSWVSYWWACCDGRRRPFSRACSVIRPCTHN